MVDKLLSWRDCSERLDDPRIAMETKYRLVSHFRDVARTEQVLILDAVEMGRLIKEMNIERAPKNAVVEGKCTQTCRRRWCSG